MNRLRVTLVLIAFALVLVVLSGCRKHYDSPEAFLKTLDIVDVDTVKVDSPFVKGWVFRIAQPLDHRHPENDTLYQRIFWSHRGNDKPVVLITEGYNFWSNHRREITQMLDANQIVVEHRYFGKSMPDSIDYAYLNMEQAAADHHAVIQTFKKFYSGKWVTTGRSKGGQTTVYHRYFYPEDVDASVPYVAPFNSAQEDPEIDDFIRSRGSEKCKQKIKDFQLAVLKHRTAMVKRLRELRKEKSFEFPFADDRILEYAVLEYPFTFWQWRSIPCDSIPGRKATAAQLFSHLKKVIPLQYYYSEENVKKQYASFYQFMTELGYYGYHYNHPGVWKALKAEPNPTNRVFGPPTVDLTFNPAPMRRVLNWIKTEGNRIVYIYGGKDPWSATRARFDDSVDALELVLETGNHAVHLRDFPVDKQELARQKLEQWLGVPVELPQKKIEE